MYKRLLMVRDLFATPRNDEFYLSKMGLTSQARGRGLGKEVVRAYLHAGRKKGFRCFRLDVSNKNTAAIRLYRKLGFDIDRKSTSREAGFTYLSMILEENNRVQDPVQE